MAVAALAQGFELAAQVLGAQVPAIAARGRRALAVQEVVQPLRKFDGTPCDQLINELSGDLSNSDDPADGEPRHARLARDQPDHEDLDADQR
jgi:hypothetical protein